jgi:hypothetical protein
VKSFALTLLTLAGLAAAASAQESLRVPADRVGEGAAWAFVDEDIDRSPGFDTESVSLPRSLAEPFEESSGSGFSLGPAGGYLRVKDADRGTWFGGVQARLRLGAFAAEASITAHQNKYEGGDVVVTQYPVQLTAFLYFLQGPIRPYILGGVGWYYTRIDHKGAFDAVSDETDHIFGEHFGAGAELFLGSRVSLNADVRYIFLNPTTDDVIGRDFNYWQITFGLNFLF